MVPEATILLPPIQRRLCGIWLRDQMPLPDTYTMGVERDPTLRTAGQPRVVTQRLAAVIDSYGNRNCENPRAERSKQLHDQKKRVGD